MKALRLLALVLSLALVGSAAQAQSVVRICVPTANAQGAPNCQDASATFPIPVQASFLFNHITTQTTTAVKATPGVLHSVCVNTAASGATATIYNNTAGSGAVIAIVDGGTKGCTTYDIAASIGITVVTAVANADITVSYR